MNINELIKDQLTELKQKYYTDTHEDEGVSYGELAMIDELVSYDEIQEEYGCMIFTPDDFFCTAGMYEEDIAIIKDFEDYNGRNAVTKKALEEYIEALHENILNSCIGLDDMLDEEKELDKKERFLFEYYHI